MKRFLVALAVCLLCVSFTSTVLAVHNGGGTLADAELIPENLYGTPVPIKPAFRNNNWWFSWYKIEAPQDGTYYITLSGVKRDANLDVNNDRGSKISGLHVNTNETKTISIDVVKNVSLYFYISQTRYDPAGELSLGICFGNRHAPGRVKTVKQEPTCTAEGVIVYPCTLCQQPSKTEYTPALGHTWTRSDYVWPEGLVYDQPATCTTDGAVHYVCSDCGASSDFVTVPHFDGANSPWGHIWDRPDYVWPAGLVIDRQPTCVMDGHAYYQCTDCGFKLETSIAHYGGASTPWGHIWDRPGYVWPQGMTIVRPATAFREGYGYYLCPDCQYMFEFTLPRLRF